MADVATASGMAAVSGRAEYDDVGGLDYVYLDLKPVREAFEKRRAVYLTEDTADVTESIEVEAPPDVVWRLVHDVDKMTQYLPTLVELDTIHGKIDEVGSVHTCLHGDGMRVVHLRVAWDEGGRRGTDRLWNVPLVREMYLTWEVKPSAAGARFSYHYAFRPGVPIEEGVDKSGFLELVRQRAQRDVQGVKALCEAEMRAQENGPPRR